KKIISIITLGLVLAVTASAHVVVKPNSAGIGAFQTFTMGVPSEKPMATVGMRLMIPEGLNFITPNVKSGWKVEVKKTKTGDQVKDDDGMMVDEERISEIDWTGGSIPEGQRDEFVFSAQVPATETTLQWKAYQTYADGSVVSWDKSVAEQPKNAQGKSDYSQFGPYSQTQVIDDLKAGQKSWWQTNQVNVAVILGVLALVLSGFALSKRP
ncbi:MAG TPA: YcnI family protein, partial [Patescibacteria group bacterium]|nr:YcnI family protein [Patescibacteria group bacterium]